GLRTDARWSTTRSCSCSTRTTSRSRSRCRRAALARAGRSRSQRARARPTAWCSRGREWTSTRAPSSSCGVRSATTSGVRHRCAEGFAALCGAARAAGLGVILDVVPNHMAVSEENPFWADPRRRATFFDWDPDSGWHRRFFDIGGLAGVRVEDPDVFAATHAKVLELVDDSLLDGLRVDHPDGLANPRAYLDRLRSEGVRHVWVEKILEPGEPL